MNAYLDDSNYHQGFTSYHLYYENKHYILINNWNEQCSCLIAAWNCQELSNFQYNILPEQALRVINLLSFI